jgi:hypothetical protein
MGGVEAKVMAKYGFLTRSGFPQLLVGRLAADGEIPAWRIA